MANFNGVLVGKTTSDKTLNKYIKAETYKSTPNAREEIKAYRDENSRNLHRVTATGHKTSISFTIRRLRKTEKEAVQTYFKNGSAFNNERKIQLYYWNDEDNDYKQAYFYIPDIEFKIRKITDNDILYDEFEVNLIEY